MYCTKVKLTTGLLREDPGGLWRVFSQPPIGVGLEKTADLGVLKGAECNWGVTASPFSRDFGAHPWFEVILKDWRSCHPLNRFSTIDLGGVELFRFSSAFHIG